MSFVNNAHDPVSHYIQGVYEEYLTTWSRRQDRDINNGVVEVSTDHADLPSLSTGRAEAEPTIASSPRDIHVNPSKNDSTHHRKSVPTVTVSPPKPRKNERNTVSSQDNTTILVDLDPASSVGRKRSKPSDDLQPQSIKRNANIAHNQSKKDTPSSGSKANPRQRGGHLENQVATPQSPTRSRSTQVQQAEPQQRDNRLRDRRPLNSKPPGSDVEAPKSTRRSARSQKSQRETESTSEAMPSESEEEVLPKSRPRRPPSSTSSRTRTPTTLKKARTTSTVSAHDLEEAERARLERKQQREATERAIAEQQAAEIRAKEVNILKCYYCWHYSQPCNLNLKPKCMACHKNRRSCFGSLTRTEFCKAYEERTGKIHKLTAKDNVGLRKALKRKRTHSSGRRKSSSAHNRPQRFFLEDKTLKCYRCWDRSLLCDLETPRCASCIKGRAACFGFRSTRQEFCEQFEEQTGHKHRWAACFEPGGGDTAVYSLGPSPRRRKTLTVHDEEETSELSDFDDWNSEISIDDDVDGLSNDVDDDDDDDVNDGIDEA